jgi:hypothetical protein
MDISNFQLDSVIGPPTENPCVGGSIPSLATNLFNHLQTLSSYQSTYVPFIVPLTLQKSPLLAPRVPDTRIVFCLTSLLNRRARSPGRRRGSALLFSPSLP